MSGEVIELKTGTGGTFRCYISRPKTAKAPGVVIGLDIFGFRPLINEIADYFASRGFLAAVPDYFWDATPNESGTYRGMYKFPTMVETTGATIAAVRAMTGCNGRVAAMGFCVGGNTAFLGAAKQGADAAASYYGTRLHTLLDEVDGIKVPTVLHIAEHDETYPDVERDNILAAVKRNPNIAAYIYAAPHGFAHSHVDEVSRALAHQRTFEIFDKLK